MPPVAPGLAVDPALAARARRFGPLAYREVGRRRLPPAAVSSRRLGGELALHLDRWWQAMGCPDPFLVVSEGPGGGELVGGLLEGVPRCGPALRVVVVEPDEVARATISTVLAVQPAAMALGPMGPGDSDDDEQLVMPGGGPLVSTLPSVPVMPGPSLRLAVRLLSTLPADLWEWDGERWFEVRLAAAAAPAAPGNGGVPTAVAESETLSEVLVPGIGPRTETPLPAGWRVFRSGAAAEWLLDARAGNEGGLVVIVDYVAASATDLAGPTSKPGVALDQIDPGGTGRRIDDEALSPLFVVEFPDGLGSGHV